MKRSRYSISVRSEKGDGWLLFNTASGRFAYFRCDNDPLENGCAQPQFNDALAEYGFLVDDDVDELAIQEAAFRTQVDDDSTLALAIAPTYACNCRCAYCYEQDKAIAKSKMSEEVIQSIFKLVEDKYLEMGFEKLWLEWYGGDPQLCLDIVERVSRHLMTWCENRGVLYDSMILSNCTRIGEEQASLLSECGVTQALVTIDGLRETHNYRRPAVETSDSFGKVVDAIGFLQDNGIGVNAVMNTDKVNALEYERLFAYLKSNYGVELSMAKLNDYAHSFGCGAFKSPEFDLYTHDEFAFDSFVYQKRAGLLDKMNLQSCLSASPRFCWGQNKHYCVVDYKGDVYKCDGWMGDSRKAVCNLVADNGVVPDAITFDPFERPDCRDCHLLPLCMGNCSWEQERCGWPCHPLLKTIDLYLREYEACFEMSDADIQLLA